jgi:hypothetical protein
MLQRQQQSATDAISTVLCGLFTPASFNRLRHSIVALRADQKSPASNSFLNLNRVEKS